ncbi:MDM2 oncogene_ E3 ubiquitin protein ligase, partial [Caligus rogercresseyi]
DGASCTGEERILIVGATNPARRRLVKRLYVPLPEPEARGSIIQRLLSSQSHSLTPSEIEEVSHLAEGYSGADMANLCKEAAMGPIRGLDYSKW